MSIATAIANQSTPVEELGLRLVGRHIFHNRSCLELTAFEDGHLLTVIGPVSVEEASNAVLPEPGTVVQFHGQEMVWLQPHTVNGNQLLAYMLINGSVQSRYINDPATIVTVPNRERESARTIELLMAQHHAYEGFKAQLNAAANEWADDNDLCGRYDEFMEDRHRTAAAAPTPISAKNTSSPMPAQSVSTPASASMPGQRTPRSLARPANVINEIATAAAIDTAVITTL